MLIRKTLLKYTKKLELLRKVHIYAATLGGLFLVLHVAYFISYPLTGAIILGYIAGAAAAVVWLTGTAFLERFKDTLFYHGSISLAAISLMVIHAASSGSNVPVEVAYVVLAVTSVVVFMKALGHARKVAKSVVPSKKMGTARPINPK
ncbi:MAG: hypothetical protein OK439_06125 [Thaumarchaeota archaeon]|nr:hypothetical protein [Nitrososphaerota archaeon]